MWRNLDAIVQLEGGHHSRQAAGPDKEQGREARIGSLSSSDRFRSNGLVFLCCLSQVIEGSVAYAMACIRRGAGWVRKNAMSRRVEFKYVQTSEVEKKTTSWEDNLWNET